MTFWMLLTKDLQKNFLYTKEKLDELVQYNKVLLPVFSSGTCKMLELDKTRMMDTTRQNHCSDGV